MGYTLKTNIANKSNYGNKRDLSSIEYIVIHYTANDGDTDENNGKYFKNNIVKSSSHYFVDDDSVTQSVPDDYVAWSVGGNKYSNCATTGGGKFYGKATNNNTLNIEICDDVKNGVVYPSAKTIENVLELTKNKMKEYNIPKENVIRHFDVNGKSCPAYWCGTAVKDSKWKSEFWNKLSLPSTNVSTSATTTKPVASTSVVINKGTVVSIVDGAKYYNGKPVPNWIVKKNWIVKEDPKGDRVVIDKSADGKNSICSPISSTYLVVVSGGTTVSTPVNTVPTPTPVVQPTLAPIPTPTVQPVVQKSLDDWAKEVLNGKHGNGHANRETSLKKAGCTYAYADVKARVNELSGVKTTSIPKPTKSIDDWAKEVINGKHGNGHANREASLKKAGCTYSYAQVRARVNALSK